MRTINHRHSAPALSSWRQNMEYHLATKRQAQINAVLSTEQPTLYTLRSLTGSQPALLSQMGVFSGTVTPVNISLLPLLLFTHSFF